ncbi:general APC amino acid permease [Punctularia strigosozonata HHB-11173 SS5]|uniref:general APC amino acid permease n=1 Tax=Punctularia strigosozonata (strain HHB-11173) TaxID=741275 RepID=UPI0004417121|nr:general APC amino acid permease [Punctularia strigosozonata HHB-11173 SS5]EIN06226.1 general APC amino acid permease [Punctularia strigosozonata HHB-11173 SS5]
MAMQFNRMKGGKEQDGTGSDTSSIEKGWVGGVTRDDREFLVDEEARRYAFDGVDLDRVQRKLKQRHVQMIAIAGTLGSGLFIGSGQALASAGPVGSLIAYALVGTVAYATMCSVGEMTSHAPVSGTFPHFAARWVDPALGFAVGWNYWYSSTITIPLEITASSLLITFWDNEIMHQYIYTTLMCFAVVMINVYGLRWFGESEFVFSVVKLLLITILIITGLVIDVGGGPDHERLGFKYWKDPGAFARANLVKNPHTDAFLGLVTVMVLAAYSFQGMELVAIAASETENPRRNIRKAVKRVFYRILLFYLLGTFVTGLLVPSNDPNLLHVSETGTAAQSPFVIAISRAGVKVLPSLINAAILTSAFSAANSYLFCGSRVLYGLALRGQAPRLFTRCSKDGLPLYAILFCGAFGFLSLMNVSQGAATVFNWLLSLSTVGGFFSWAAINLTYIFFYRGMKAQGIDRRRLVYSSRLQPILAWWGLAWNVIFILVAGLPVFFQFTAAGFVTAYINIPFFAALFLFWKLKYKTRMWKPREMDFFTGIPTVEETEQPEEPPTTLSEKILATIF